MINYWCRAGQTSSLSSDSYKGSSSVQHIR